MQFASLDEVWGSSFPKKHAMTSKHYTPEPKRDAEKEGRIFSSPQKRTAHAMQTHKKTIDDLSASLPIAEKDEDYSSNFAPARVAASRENFTATKQSQSNPYQPVDVGGDFPYAHPNFQHDAQEIKLNRILHLIEQNQIGVETPSSQDMMLYVFTGIFFLFTFDTFVSLGKRMK
jgi:hypothetical protein